jgi:hypothetical protein
VVCSAWVPSIVKINELKQTITETLAMRTKIVHSWFIGRLFSSFAQAGAM